VEVMMVGGLFGRREQEGLLKCLQEMEPVTIFEFPVLLPSKLDLSHLLLSLVVNCVQSHPFDCAVATSGIDNTIKVYHQYSLLLIYMAAPLMPLDIMDVH
jgi:hypothetical protein